MNLLDVGVIGCAVVPTFVGVINLGIYLVYAYFKVGEYTAYRLTGQRKPQNSKRKNV